MRIALSVFFVYSGAATSVSLIVAAAATRLPDCQSVWVFLGVFVALALVALVCSDSLLQVAARKWQAMTPDKAAASTDAADKAGVGR